MPLKKDQDISPFKIETELMAAGGRYLIREEEEPTVSLIITPDQSKDQAQIGTIISVGQSIFKDGAFVEPEGKVGDLVYFEKWKGVEIEHGRGRDRRKYKLIEFHFLAGIIKYKD